jgi:hypothetical protein
VRPASAARHERTPDGTLTVVGEGGILGLTTLADQIAAIVLAK